MVAPALRILGVVESSLTDAADAPRQPDEGAPPARLVMLESVRDALRGLRVGDDIFVLTWLHRADRDTLQVHPRDDATRPMQGVFSTRSADRPNPVGLHRVRVTAIDGLCLHVDHLEALNGTPIIDIKPVLGGEVGER